MKFSNEAVAQAPLFPAAKGESPTPRPIRHTVNDKPEELHGMSTARGQKHMARGSWKRAAEQSLQKTPSTHCSIVALSLCGSSFSQKARSSKRLGTARKAVSEASV